MAIIIRTFLLLFFKKFLWVHYVLTFSLFLVADEYFTMLSTVLFLNLFIQQFKMFAYFEELITLFKLYQYPIYFMAITYFVTGFLLLMPLSPLIDFRLIFGILFPGLLFNLIKIKFHAN